MRLAADVPNEIRAEAARKPKLAENLESWAHESEKRTKLQNSVYLARSLPGIEVGIDAFDCDPCLFAVDNGVIELKSSEFRPHRPADLITSISPMTCDPDAKCKMWERFLREIFAEDVELIQSMQVAAGYWLTGLSVEPNIWTFYGQGRNGKGVFVRTLRGLMGPYAGSAPRDTFVQKHTSGIPTDLAGLRGKRLCVCDEFLAEKPDEELLKHINGGDRLSARFLHNEYFEFDPTFKVLIVTNERLRFSSHNDAIWDRLIEVPFTVKIPEEKRNPHLAEELAEERSGILNWALEGVREYFATGLSIQKSVRDASSAAREENDTVIPFVDECIRCTSGEKIPLESLYNKYTYWCNQHGIEALTMRDLNRELEKRYEFRRGRTASTRFWCDIELVRD